jgi:hypothetical protein
MFADDTDYGYYIVDDDAVGTAIPTASLVCGASTTGAVTSNSLYYELSLASYTTLTISTCNDATNFDSILELYDHSRSKIIAWNDDDADSCVYGSQLSKFEKTFPAGNYLIRVLEYGERTFPDFQL